jgi:hypothetical protein
MTIRFSIPLLILLMLVSSPLFAEHMTIDKQIQLSTVHRGVTPYVVSRASNGDFFVAGAIEELGYRPWAMRVSPNGEVRWEFAAGESDRGTDRSVPGQRFNGVIELPDQTTIFCGTENENKRAIIVLDRIGIDGSLIEQRIVQPSRLVTTFSCAKWNDAIVLVGGVFGTPAGTGWLAKIDAQLNLQWEKFSDDYANGDIVETAGGGLFLISRTGNLIKLGPSGDILARKTLPDGEQSLVHPVASGSTVSVAMMLSTLETEILRFDDQLQGPTGKWKVHNVGVKKCLELPDGSITIFGSQFHNSATAAVTRIYKDGSSKGFLLEPPYQSPWYEDAVFTGNKNQFAAVRLVNSGQAVLDWVSFK